MTCSAAMGSQPHRCPPRHPSMPALIGEMGKGRARRSWVRTRVLTLLTFHHHNHPARGRATSSPILQKRNGTQKTDAGPGLQSKTGTFALTLGSTTLPGSITSGKPRRKQRQGPKKVPMTWGSESKEHSREGCVRDCLSQPTSVGLVLALHPSPSSPDPPHGAAQTSQAHAPLRAFAHAPSAVTSSRKPLRVPLSLTVL